MLFDLATFLLYHIPTVIIIIFLQAMVKGRQYSAYTQYWRPFTIYFNIVCGRGAFAWSRKPHPHPSFSLPHPWSLCLRHVQPKSCEQARSGVLPARRLLLRGSVDGGGHGGMSKINQFVMLCHSHCFVNQNPAYRTGRHLNNCWSVPEWESSSRGLLQRYVVWF